MLPSTSSPVEAVPTPVSPSAPHPCQPQYVGEGKEGAVRDEYPSPYPPELGMCGTEEGQEGRVANSPPDLCTRDNTSSQIRGNRAQSVEEAVGGAAIAQGGCDYEDYEYPLNDSLCGDRRVDSMEEGACGLAPSHQYTEEALYGAEGVMCGPKAALPDLCDTSGGARNRINHLSCKNISVEDMQYQLSGEGGGNYVLECDNAQRLERERGRQCESYKSDLTETSNMDSKNDIPGGVLETESGMTEELPVEDCVDGSRVIPKETIETRNPENRDESSHGGGNAIETSVIYKDNNSVDMIDSHDLEMAIGPLENYLIHDNQQISLVACGITQCDPSFQDHMSLTEPSEDEDGMSLIKYNLHHSSHPMYDKWPCYFYITEEHLPSFTIDSHGRHIGSVRKHWGLVMLCYVWKMLKLVPGCLCSLAV